MTSRPEPPFKDQKLSPPGLEEKMDPAPQYKGEHYASANKLKGKVALITGGDSGIGRSVAYLFAREGAKVAITHLPAEKKDAQRLSEELHKDLNVDLLTIETDTTSEQECRAAVAKVIDMYKGLNILVNNAAFQNHVDNFEDISLDQWDHTFKVNIYGYYFMTRAALPYMGAGDCIINSGSVTGLVGNPTLVDYSSTKGAIHTFTKSLAKKLIDKRIRVNCVAPGPVWTPLNPAERSADDMKEFGGDTALGRPAQPDEIAPAFVFLASNGDSGYMTGEVINILGGDTMAG